MSDRYGPALAGQRTRSVRLKRQAGGTPLTWIGSAIVASAALAMPLSLVSAPSPLAKIDQLSESPLAASPSYSTSTTPVEFKIGNVRYRAPRNYLSQTALGFPTISVTYPGFLPFSDSQERCFHTVWRPGVGCSFLEIRMRLPYSSRKATARFLSGLRATRTNKGPAGFSRVDVGPPEARIIIFENVTAGIYATCISSRADDPDPVCEDTFSLKDSNAASFFFPRTELARLPEIEHRLRSLVDCFVVREESVHPLSCDPPGWRPDRSAARSPAGTASRPGPGPASSLRRRAAPDRRSRVGS